MIEPSLIAGKWTILKDPDDQLLYAANVAADLAVSGTTIASVECLVQGVEKLSEPTFVGGKVSVKLGGLAVTAGAVNCCTFRITCANGERFDRTIYFKQEDH